MTNAGVTSTNASTAAAAVSSVVTAASESASDVATAANITNAGAASVDSAPAAAATGDVFDEDTAQVESKGVEGNTRAARKPAGPKRRVLKSRIVGRPSAGRWI